MRDTNADDVRVPRCKHRATSFIMSYHTFVRTYRAHVKKDSINAEPT